MFPIMIPWFYFNYVNYGNIIGGAKHQAISDVSFGNFPLLLILLTYFSVLCLFKRKNSDMPSIGLWSLIFWVITIAIFGLLGLINRWLI